MKLVDQVYRSRQSDFISIPGEPWVYWIPEGLRSSFETKGPLRLQLKIKLGLSSVDMDRFYRYRWEVPANDKWLTLVKGGEYCKWFGLYNWATNWEGDGAEQKSEVIHRYPYLKGNYGLKIRDEEWYGRAGASYNRKGGDRFSARLLPEGCVFDDNGPAIFSDEIDASIVLGLINSKVINYILNLLNPGIDFQKGDLERVPVPDLKALSGVKSYVDHCIYVAKLIDSARENSQFFIAPLPPDQALEIVSQWGNSLREAEREIDKRIFAAYEVKEEEQEIIQESIPDVNLLPSTDKNSIGVQWISYALGIVMGRFQPGDVGALGSAIVKGTQGNEEHYFSAEVEGALAGLAAQDGIVVLDPDREDNLSRRVARALILMLGEAETEKIVVTIGGDAHDMEGSLRSFIEKDFYTKFHVKWYQKRPIYWLLQSSRKTYGFYLYLERITRDTLPLIRGTSYLLSKMNGLGQAVEAKRDKARSAQGKEKRQIEKDIEKIETQITDLESFDQALRRALEAQNERGQTVGWDLEIDDGVIINLAPLYELLPSWKTEPKKYWDALERGDYDWSNTAMRYWPDRVLEKCRVNKSYALAHNRLDVYEGNA